MSHTTVVKVSGVREPWDPHKLERSLFAARADKDLVKKIVELVERDMYDGMHTRDVYRHAFALLKRYDRPVAAQYSLKKALAQLGPSGFPFERFIASILHARGYHTQVGVMIPGECVEHEVDVIAEKEDERMIVEAKFHNSQEIKTDVKVALYVHARFQDIHKRFIAEDKLKQHEHFDRAWLITNTSFTSQAIQYGACAGLSMTGWNYPTGRTLQDLVQETKTHPLTCLTTLTGNQKNALLEGGTVLCRDIITNTRPLEHIGISKARIAAIQEEGERVCTI